MKPAVGLIIGAIAGLVLSYASRKIEGQCIVLCNPYVAGVFGAVLGFLIALEQDR